MTREVRCIYTRWYDTELADGVERVLEVACFPSDDISTEFLLSTEYDRSSDIVIVFTGFLYLFESYSGLDESIDSGILSVFLGIYEPVFDKFFSFKRYRVNKLSYFFIDILHIFFDSIEIITICFNRYQIFLFYDNRRI